MKFCQRIVSVVRYQLLSFVCCMLACATWAEDPSTWAIGYPNPKDVIATYKDGKLTISGKGDMVDWTRYYIGTVWPLECFTTPWVENSYITSIVVEEGVTSIGQCAFVGLPNLQSVSIAGSVGRIGWLSFQYCSKLIELDIPEGVTNIDSFAFSDCSGVTSVSLPSSLQSIGDSAFYHCSSIKSMTVPACVASVGTLLSGSNSSVERVTVREGRTEVPASMFAGLTSLQTVALPDGIVEIADAAFDGCGSLIAVNLPSSLKNIGWCAFRGCPLTELRIPAGVTNIANYAFTGCGGLTSVKLPLGLQSIGAGAFENCYGVKSVELSHCGAGLANVFMSVYYSITNAVVLPGTERIDDKLFAGCSGLQSVSLPDGLVDIGQNAFEGCSSLSRLRLPPSVRGLGTSCFASSGLASLEIPEGVTNVSDSICYDCRGLESVVMHPGVTHIGAFAFSYTYDALKSVVIPATVTSIDPYAFYKSSGIASVVIPSCVTCVLETFSWSNPTNVVMHEGRTEIPDAMFDGCAITAVDIPSTVTSIGWCAFRGCPLTELRIPAGVTNIANYAFTGCGGLTSVKLPLGLQSIGAGAFENCGIRTVYVDPGDAVRIKGLYGWNYDVEFIEWGEYEVVLNKYDGTTTAVSQTFASGATVKLPTIAKLGWARRGMVFKGWATSESNAKAGKVWKKDGASVKNAIGAGRTLSVYAVWGLAADAYAIQYVRNDGAGTVRTVGFTYDKQLNLNSINGLGWARRGYEFLGWATSTANARAGKVWKTDAAPVKNATGKGKLLTIYAIWKLKSGFYEIRFNKNDGTGKWRALGYERGKATALPTCANGLGWTYAGYTFKGWATSAANAKSGKVWKTDAASVKNATASGKTLNVYAVWVKTAAASASIASPSSSSTSPSSPSPNAFASYTTTVYDLSGQAYPAVVKLYANGVAEAVVTTSEGAAIAYGEGVVDGGELKLELDLDGTELRR